MRLNDKETRLINFIRRTNFELLLTELRTAFTNSVNKANYLNLKNIIVTGRIGVGKTTSLNSLLDYQENAKIMIFEQVKELNLNEEILNRNIVTCQESESISMKDISVLNDAENSRLVI